MNPFIASGGRWSRRRELAIASAVWMLAAALPTLANQSAVPALPALPAVPEAPASSDTQSVDVARGDDTRAVNEHRPLKADGHVSVSNIAGSIEVSGWDHDEVSITGTLGDGVDHLEVSGDASQLSVEVKLPKSSHVTGDTHLKLMVPARASVDLVSVSADIAATGLRAVVRASTVSGDVDLELDASQVSVRTVSGDLTLRAPSQLTDVNSVSGDLRLNGPRGDLSATTVSGNLELQGGGPFHQIKLKTISGDSRADVSLTDDGHVVGESLSGDINLIVPATLAGTADLKSFSGEARCSSAAATSSSDHGKAHEYIWGNGQGAHIDLSSFSGDIHVDRK
jgi:DUF4097 and DUF4098 domain-containing protein YvlB